MQSEAAAEKGLNVVWNTVRYQILGHVWHMDGKIEYWGVQ